MVIIHMAVERKMHNLIYKTCLLISVGVVAIFSFSSISFADNYNEGLYNAYSYSATSPSTDNQTTGTTQAFRDKFLVEQKAGLLVQNPVPTTTPTTPASSKITKTLKLKMTNSDVKLLQIYLNNHGYSVSTIGAGSLGKETNYFGLKTKQAVIKFQIANKLKPDGVVGPLTRSKFIQ